jgi:hypothetical protein
VGLDLVVEGCAAPGHEPEWRRLLERSFAGHELSEEDVARFHEISIPGYERIGAPRVGFDSAADAWMIGVRKAKTPEDIAAVLKESHGYYVLRLVKCDGVPNYSHVGMYDGIDETSFRGAFLSHCEDVLSNDLMVEAWDNKFPEAAVSYGQALLAAADVAETASRTPKPWRTILSLVGLAKTAEPAALAQQLDVVRAAGRWYVFWGERGHPIRAWF